MSSTNMLVVGLDGACWPLIDPWLESGDLPNLRSLKKQGRWGEMKSSVPPVTCPAWKCYSTGKNPGKLGIYWWETLDMESQSSVIPDATDFDQPEIWDYLNDAGIKTGVLGMPLTYPPKQVDGYMVAGGPSARTKGFASPRRIERDLRRELNYTPSIETVGSKTDDEAAQLDPALEQVKQNFRASEYLIENYDVDFHQVCTFQLNSPIQHFVYDGDHTKRAWEYIDDYLGRIADDFDYVLIHSDHGTAPMNRIFNINAWLEREGYLVQHTSWGDWLAKAGLHRERLSGLARRSGLFNVLSKSSILRSLYRRVPDSGGSFGQIGGEATFDKIDMERTKVVGSAQGPLYINEHAVEDIDAFKQELQARLTDISDPESGKQPIETVLDGDDVYEGAYADRAPDLVAVEASNYHTKGGIGKSAVFEKSVWQGNNSTTGLYLLAGKGISHERVDIDIYDLAPTILNLWDIDVPEDIDGERWSEDSS